MIAQLRGYVVMRLRPYVVTSLRGSVAVTGPVFLLVARKGGYLPPPVSMKPPFCSENEKIAEVLHRHGGASILHISLDSAETPEVLHRHGGASILHISLDSAETPEVLHRHGGGNSGIGSTC